MVVTRPVAKPNSGRRKNKRHWRTNVDLQDVERSLNDQRLEQILGGAFNERSDSSLFVVDGSCTKVPNESGREGSWNIGCDNTEWQLRNLKCFQSLMNKSAVPDPIRKRNRVRSTKERQCRNIALRQEQRLARKQALRTKNKPPGASDSTSLNFDLWASDGVAKSTVEPPETDLFWLSEDTRRVNSVKEFASIQPPADYLQKLSTVDVVAPPDPGQSYNPSLEDHQSLLWQAASAELADERERRKLDGQTVDRFARVSRNESDAMYEKEMSEGLTPENESDSPANCATEGDVDDVSIGSVNHCFAAKTTKQHRLERQRRLAEARARSVNAENRTKSHQLHNVIAIARQVKSKQRLSAAKALARLRARRLREKTVPHRLGPIKFDASCAASDRHKVTTEYLRGCQLSGNLRSMRPVGCLLADRFVSLQQRNVIETRIRRMSSAKTSGLDGEGRKRGPKKRKKVVLKRSHREFSGVQID